jgi:hypothetical protein
VLLVCSSSERHDDDEDADRLIKPSPPVLLVCSSSESHDNDEDADRPIDRLASPLDFHHRYVRRALRRRHNWN